MDMVCLDGRVFDILHVGGKASSGGRARRGSRFPRSGREDEYTNSRGAALAALLGSAK